MKHLITLLLSAMVLAMTGALQANEEVTKSIDVVLDSESTITTIAATEEKTLTKGKNDDGTQTINGFSFNSVSFSATGSSDCLMTITSDYKDSNGQLLLAKNTEDLSQSIAYDLTTSSLSMQGKLGTKKVNGTVVADSAAGATVSISGWNASVEDNDDNNCLISFSNPRVTNFRTNDGEATENIPADWTGERTGNVIFTMTAS